MFPRNDQNIESSGKVLIYVLQGWIPAGWGGKVIACVLASFPPDYLGDRHFFVKMLLRDGRSQCEIPWG